MAQFLDYSTFYWNGVSSERYGLYIVSTGSVNEERIFGLNSSMVFEDKIFTGRKDDIYKLNIEIMKLDAFNMVLPMHEKEYDEIIKWLTVDEPKILEVAGIIHYGMFTSGTEFHNPKRQGIINLTFESASPYPYSKVLTSILKVSGSKTIKLENKSNVSNKIYMDIDIEKTGVAGSVEIVNRRIGKSFKINNIAVGEQIRVLGESVFEVESITNKTRNMYKDLEYDEFPYLNYGANNIEIIGDCKIRIRYQYPIALR